MEDRLFASKTSTEIQQTLQSQIHQEVLVFNFWAEGDSEPRGRELKITKKKQITFIQGELLQAWLSDLQICDE